MPEGWESKYRVLASGRNILSFFRIAKTKIYLMRLKIDIGNRLRGNASWSPRKSRHHGFRRNAPSAAFPNSKAEKVQKTQIEG